jgi:hypothetical protein
MDIDQLRKQAADKHQMKITFYPDEDSVPDLDKLSDTDELAEVEFVPVNKKP